MTGSRGKGPNLTQRWRHAALGAAAVRFLVNWFTDGLGLASTFEPIGICQSLLFLTLLTIIANDTEKKKSL